MSATVEQIRNDALTVIGEVAGSGVQTYSEDRITRDVIRSFDLLFKKYNWEQYSDWLHLELDGSTGVIKTDSLEAVRDFEDFISVHPDGKDFALSVLPRSLNPLRLTSGVEPLYFTSLNVSNAYYRKRKLKIYPITATGFIDIHAMIYPITTEDNDWEDDTVIYLDRSMMAYGTAFMTLSADDLNPQGAATAQSMMEMRYRDIMSKLSSHKIPISGRGGIPASWTVR